MLKTTASLVSAGSLALVALAGCGGGDKADNPAVKKPAVSAAALDPLAGSYKTRLNQRDVPKTAYKTFGADVKRGSWVVKITTTGGVNNGAALIVTHSKFGQLTSAIPQATADRLVLTQELCPADNSTATGTYRFTISGDKLVLRAVSDGCADGVMRAILTSHPLERSSR